MTTALTSTSKQMFEVMPSGLSSLPSGMRQSLCLETTAVDLNQPYCLQIAGTPTRTFPTCPSTHEFSMLNTLLPAGGRICLAPVLLLTLSAHAAGELHVSAT